MTDLREPLEDLVAEVPAYVGADAGAAWRAGRRRRHRRRLGTVAAVAALVVLAGGVVNQLPRASEPPVAGGDPAPGVTGHPGHVLKPWFERDLPDQPGPLALLVHEGGSQWHGVSAEGRTWRVGADVPVDDFPPVLSEDGRMLGFLDDGSGYVIRDLVTGAEHRFDEIGDNRSIPRDETHWLAPQTPGFWSPDGSRLFLPAHAWDTDADGGGLVLDPDGSVQPVPRRVGWMAGWLDADTLAWVRASGEGRARTAALVATRVTGEVVKRVPLDLRAREVDGLSQWSPTLSPDRARLAVALGHTTGALVTISTLDGSVIRRENVGIDGGCVTSWTDGEPAFSNYDGTLATTSGRVQVSVDPRMDIYCVMAAADALAGERHVGLAQRLFGDTWLAWRWREVAVGALGGIAMLGAGAWL
uniref:hypothetical protein n=1 Tax=Nocardioides sp. TaxID=35761 RepID=UPI00356B4C29